MGKVHYAMFRKYPDGWGQFAVLGELEAMHTWLYGKGEIRAVNLDTGAEATWYDYRDGQS